MSTAQKLFETAQSLPEQAQDVLLRLAEMLAASGTSSPAPPKPHFRSAKRLIKIGPDIDQRVEDFKHYME